MHTHCEYTSYESTGHFSRIMLDYISGDEKLKTFYKYPVSLEGIKASIAARTQFDTPRNLLVAELRKQYAGITLSDHQQQNLELLLLENTFTICTAHQPNIFTGHLYFIYKILHAVRLADFLNKELPEHKFVPVYYIGSEDADLDELGHINLNGEKLEWQTKQTGAVGRMMVDKELIKLIDIIAGELEVFVYGKALVALLKDAYVEGVTIQQATLNLVNALFAEFGLLVLIPDNAELKRQFTPVVQKELSKQFSYPLVAETGEQLRQNYKVQAGGRELNLFYLTDNKRERIEKQGETFIVDALKLKWNEEEILTEAAAYPERFSANVILRGVFQESVLPNIAFIGGGGEIAYWLELQKVFEAVNVPFPVLIVRNSFLVFNQVQKHAIAALGFTALDLFRNKDGLVNELVARESDLQLTLSDEKGQLNVFYNKLKEITEKIDPTLAEHTSALHAKALDKVKALEKKMLRAEKRKFEAQQRKITKLKQQLFPNDRLQERVDNFSPYYAKYGKDWLRVIYEASLGLEQQFGIVEAE